MSSKDIAIVAVFGIAALLAIANLMRPVLRAWARRLEASVEHGDVIRELVELRERVASLESGQGRMQELEERVDFSERLLAQHTAVVPVHRTPQ